MVAKKPLKSISKGKPALLVTSDPTLRNAYDEAFENRKSKWVIGSLQDIQEICKTYPMSIIFVDQGLPEKNAEKLIDEIYRNNPNTSIVLLVDYLNDDVVFRIWDKVDDLVRKPVDESSFRRILELYGQCKDPGMPPHLMITLQISHRYNDPNFTQHQMAQELGFTPTYLSRLYKEKVGVTFQDALHKVRINAARKLLRDTDLLVKQIAHQVGYKRVDSFVRNFQQTQKISPLDFRRYIRLNGKKSVVPSKFNIVK